MKKLFFLSLVLLFTVLGCRKQDYVTITKYTYDNSELYKFGDYEYDVSNIKNIDIDYVYGNVYISLNDSNKINIKESIVENDEHKVHHYLSNNTLYIKFVRSTDLLKTDISNKSLEILVPNVLFDKIKCNMITTGAKISNIQSTILDINTVSGNVNMDSINCEKVFIDTITGTCNLDKYKIKEATISTTSGNSYLNGGEASLFTFSSISGDLFIKNSTIHNLSTNTTSGEVDVLTNFTPVQIDCHTMSGNVTLRLPSSSEFICTFDTISGNFNNNFGEYVLDNNNYKFGSLYMLSINVSSTNGDLSIYPNM